MKTTILLAMMIMGMTFSCSRIKEKSAEELLENSKMRDEVYSAILNNHDYSTGLLNKMMESEKCKMIMTGNLSMMKMMCTSDKMENLMNTDKEVMENLTGKLIKRMKTDSVVCDHTCTMLMENEQLKNYFTKHSSKQPKGS